jgi:hypothetical protein
LDDKHDVTVCDVYNGVKPRIVEANAHLLAASPQLFEALEPLVSLMSTRAVSRTQLNILIEAGKKALAAALGEGEER